MTTFLDGPARGQHLSLRRAPLLLRVVRYAGRDRRRIGWDALDQPEDQPRRDEEVYVYILTEEPTAMHLCIRGKGKKEGGWYQVGKYRHVADAPPDDVLRDNERWRQWTLENYEWLAPAWWKARKKPNSPPAPAGDPHVGNNAPAGMPRIADPNADASADHGSPTGEPAQ